jgi:hypothetical protein
MNERRKLEDRIRRKEAEIIGLETQIREARVYVQALQDALRLFPKDTRPESLADATLRPGSAMARARDIIRERQKPVHITDLLRAMGKEITRTNRASLSGSLSAYARRGEIFVRTAPNTFGLVELAHENESEIAETMAQPPSDFGSDQQMREENEVPF